MRHLIAVICVLVTVSIVLAENTFTGQYKKKNGEINVQALPDNRVKFWINTVVGMHPCNIGDDNKAIAVFVDSKRAAFTDDQNCTILLNFGKNNVKVTTKNCDGYCGAQAAGSMDGVYNRKSSRPDFPK